MGVTQASLKNPAAVAVGVAIVVVFGAISLTRLPMTLFPHIDKPVITVGSFWRAAAPAEVESEIIEPLEEVLSGLPGLSEMASFAGSGGGNVYLEFELGTNMQNTLIEVINRLSRLKPLPADAIKPQVVMGQQNDQEKTLTWLYVQKLPTNPNPMDQYQSLVEDSIVSRFEALDGVASVQLVGFSEKELRITFDPFLAAEHHIIIPEVAKIAGRANDVSGGFVDVGRREYTLRFAGRYAPEDLRELILVWRDGKPVRLGDIADVAIVRSERRNFAIANGQPAIALRIDKNNDANALQVLGEIRATMAELDERLLVKNGLRMSQSFDAGVFIERAITLVTNNVFIGALLAGLVLWWFFRSVRATMLVAIAIPVSLLATFIVLKMTGRSLNVISLAGLAFAVGMVLDAAIVVLENIVRLRSEGHQDAELTGTMQVWGAMLASTATTVAIFLPVMFIDDVEGQLFADLALTIAIAVVISFFVATTVLPVAAQAWLPAESLDSRSKTWDQVAHAIARFTDVSHRRWGAIVVLMSLPIIATVVLLPNTDYLPPVKRDSIDAFINLPAGGTVAYAEEEVANVMMDRLEPYRNGERDLEVMNDYAIFFGPWGGLVGARPKDPSQLADLERVMRTEIVAGIPDTQIFVQRGNLFGNIGGGGRDIMLYLQSRDYDGLIKAAEQAIDIVESVIPEAVVRTSPPLAMAQPEIRLIPRDRELIEAGWTRVEAGNVVRAMGNGLYIGEYFDGEERMNVILRSQPWATPEDLAATPLYTPAGGVVQLGQLMDVERTVGPSFLERVDGRRTIRLGITPPPNVALQDVVDTVRTEIEPRLEEILPSDGTVRYAGSAADMGDAVMALGQNFLLAIFILFALMAALFRSMLDSLMVMLSIPLATVGSVIALVLLNFLTFQPLDLLTMIGFVILLGLVVNNAILLVHQTRAAEANGATRGEAVEQALRIRTRPILMSTLTSLVGMLPLLLTPGAGSTIYRGLAAAIVGGMSVSALFVMVLLPCLLRLGESHQVIDLNASAQPQGAK